MSDSSETMSAEDKTSMERKTSIGVDTSAEGRTSAEGKTSAEEKTSAEGKRCDELKSEAVATDREAVAITPRPSTTSNVVDFEGADDPYNAMNWPIKKKLVVTLLYSLCTMSATFASTVYNSGIYQVERRFAVNSETALAGMSLYLFGNAFGPLLWAPMSEAYGRKPSILIPIFGLGLFSFATATAKDIQTLLITRFFAGVFGGAPLSNTGGVLADVWPATQRGPALLAWGLTITIGPLLAPIIGGALAIAEPTTGWRWTEYVTGIFVMVSFVCGLIWIEESYAPVLLARKAHKMRIQTKNWALHAASEETGITWQEMSRKYLIVPFEMLIDPIAFFMNLYSAFTYAIVYLAVPALSYEFAGIRRWNAIVSTIPFTAMIIGVIFGGVILAAGAAVYKKKVIANGNKMIPELRLLPMMIGSIFFTAGLFIMGWTGKASIHWIGFCIGAACVGLGFFAVFQSALSYLVDTYLIMSASTLAANMFMRSMLAGAFPLFTKALFDNLGINWGLSLLGFVAAAMLPIPYLFYIFGKRLRAKGKHSRKTFMA